MVEITCRQPSTNRKISCLQILAFVIVLGAISMVAFSGAAAADTLTVSENETIQEVIDDASDGDTVVIPDGEYQEELTIDDDITLSGSGDTVLDGDGESLDTAIAIDAGSVTIEDITIKEFDDRAIEYEPPSVGGQLDLTIENTNIADIDNDAIELDADNVDAEGTVDNVEIRNSDGDAIKIDSVFGDLTIQNSELISNSYGVTGEPFDITISDTTIDRSSNYGVILTGPEDVSITDSSITDSDDDNVNLNDLPSDSDISFDAVTVSDADDKGIVIDGAETATFDDVTAQSVDDEALEINAETSELSNIDASESGGSHFRSDAAIVIEGDETDISDVEITPGGGEKGIYINGVETVDIADTEVEESSEDNIRIEADSGDEEITITDTVASDSSSGDGIRIAGTSSTTVDVDDVDASGNDDVGIDVEGGDVTIENVDAMQNADAALEIDAENSELSNTDASDSGGSHFRSDAAIEIEGSETDISDVDITPGRSGKGIYINDVGTVSINNAEVEENPDANIRIDSDSSDEDISIEDTTVKDSSGDEGITIDASSSSNIELTDITATGNDEDGIEVDGGDVTIDDVEAFDNSDHGIDIESASEATISNAEISGSGDNGISFGSLSADASITESTITDNSGHEVENNADRNVEISDSTVGLFGAVDDDSHGYISGNVILGSGVETENPEVDTGLVADFTIDPTPAGADHTITFDGSSTTVLGGADVEYEWDLTGDGNIDQTGELADRSFDEGTYDITLYIEDSEGREDSETQSLEVGPSGINAQITTTQTELTTEDTTAIEYSITNFLTNEESEVQMIVENPSGVQISSTHNVQESSNQVTLTETVAPSEQENFRFTVSPNEPGEFEVKAIANYESEDGTEVSEIEETTTFEVVDPDAGLTDDDSPGFTAVSMLMAMLMGIIYLTRKYGD